MAVLSTNEEIATRFAPYLKELHELFALHGVAFGAPNDLPEVVGRLDRGGYFAEDVSSILRSIILREGGSLPQTELLEVLALAAAGPDLDPSMPEIQPAFRRLLTFVGAIARRPWNIPPGEPLAVTADAAEPIPLPAALPARPETVPQPPALHTANGYTPDPVPNGHLPAAAPLANGFRPFAPRVEPEESDTAAHPGIPPPKPSGGNPSWPLWIAAACAILAVLLLFLFDRAHPPQAAPETVVSPAPSAANPAATGAAIPSASQSPASQTRASQPGASQPLAFPARKPSAATPATTARRPATLAPATPARAGTPSAPQAAASTASTSAASSTTGPSQTASPSRAASQETTGSAADSAPTRTSPAPLQTAASDLPAAARRPAIALPRPGRDGFFQVSPAAMAAHLVHSTDPGYPMLARVTRVQGQVTLQAVISPGGEVVSAHAINGPHLLRGAAASAVKQWLYRPFFVNGHPVYVSTTVAVDFREHR